MFGIGMPELMLIFVLALLVFGPKELPRIARTLGKAMAELRRASDELRDGIQREIELAERTETPPAPPEAVPSTTLGEGTTSAPETHPSPTMGAASVDGGVSPRGTVAEEALTEPTTTPAPSGQVGETPPKDVSETATPSVPPVTGEAKAAQEVPGEHRPEDKTAPHPPSQPVETRNA